MNIYLYLLIVITYAVVASWVIRDYRRAFRAYNIKHNGSRFVVRDSKGRFVLITKSRWDISALGGGL